MVRGNNLLSGFFLYAEHEMRTAARYRYNQQTDDRLDLVKPCSGIPEKLTAFRRGTDSGNDR